mmetsp:Transcript_104635/g.337376  ORF Transcript_104635/g.337376 Transcript_104635/m.337376 type:complete len:210 (-) Transcript_104635:571-1200(-)
MELRAAGALDAGRRVCRLLGGSEDVAVGGQELHGGRPELHEQQVLPGARHRLFQEERRLGGLQGGVQARPGPLGPGRELLGLQAAGGPHARHPEVPRPCGRLGGEDVCRRRRQLRGVEVLQRPRQAVLPEERRLGHVHGLLHTWRPRERPGQVALDLPSVRPPDTRELAVALSLLLGPDDVRGRRAPVVKDAVGQGLEPLQMRGVGCLQ